MPQLLACRTKPVLRFVTMMLGGGEPGRKAAETIAARLSRYWWVRTVILPESALQPDTVPENELLALLGRPH